MIRGLLIVGVVLSGLLGGLYGQEAPAPDPFQLGLVLKHAREYCSRLERAALDFVCLEEVSEMVDLSRESVRSAVTQMPTNRVVTGAGAGTRAVLTSGPTKLLYLFDYHCVRQAGQVKENRVLIEKNGKKAKPKADIPRMNVFQCSEILLMPVKLLDERAGDFYSYRLLREDILNGAKVWVLDVVPRLSAGGYLGGRLWIGQNDSSVLKIEWDPTTFGHYESILKNAATYKEEPRVTSYTEFGYEKNGLSFPSLDFTEEAYISAKGKKFIRSQTKVVYRDFKFFTVETEATFGNEKGLAWGEAAALALPSP
jgi:hypothetical protein